MAKNTCFSDENINWKTNVFEFSAEFLTQNMYWKSILLDKKVVFFLKNRDFAGRKASMALHKKIEMPPGEKSLDNDFLT